MRKISIQTLKATLSAAIAEAESGETVVITRHNRAVAHLAPPAGVNTHGDPAAAASLTPLLRLATKGRYLDVLLEDRAGEQ